MVKKGLLLKRFVRSVLEEAKFVAAAPGRMNLPDVEVEADDTRTAGKLASLKYKQEHGADVDEFSIAVTEAEDAPVLDDEGEVNNGIVNNGLNEQDFVNFVTEVLDGDPDVLFDVRHVQEMKDLLKNSWNVSDTDANEVIDQLELIGQSRDTQSPIHYSDCLNIVALVKNLREFLENLLGQQSMEGIMGVE